MRRADVLARITRLSEALEDGDLELVRRGLEDLAADLRRRPPRCPECGMRFQWPGERDEHVRTLHPEAWEATVAA